MRWPSPPALRSASTRPRWPPTVTGTAAQGATQPATFLPRYGQSFGGFSDGTGGGSPWDGTTSGSPSDGTTTGPTAATAAQQAGIVEINTVLGYQGAQAAGTGMVLTPTGEILTNNHVVDGATRISVTIASTGATYPATVVGTDPTGDIAVLQLAGASGLQTANLSTGTAAVGERGDRRGQRGRHRLAHGRRRIDHRAGPGRSPPRTRAPAATPSS